jgi:hypothetical protein
MESRGMGGSGRATRGWACVQCATTFMSASCNAQANCRSRQAVIYVACLRLVVPGNNGQIPYEEHDARLRSADSLLGVPGLRGHSVTHPGGVCVLWHNDIIHRKSRQRPWGRDLGPAPKRVDLSVDPNHGVSFRPILRLGFHRCSEPDAAPSPGLVDDEEWTAAIGGDGPPRTCGHRISIGSLAAVYRRALASDHHQPRSRRWSKRSSATRLGRRTGLLLRTVWGAQVHWNLFLYHWTA